MVHSAASGSVPTCDDGKTETARHTPGPWGVEDPMDHGLTIVGNPDAPVYDWKWVATCDWPDEDNHLITSAEVKANARLIAAAPELLEALISTRDGLQAMADEGIVAHGSWPTIDAAIAKALGTEA